VPLPYPKLSSLALLRVRSGDGVVVGVRSQEVVPRASPSLPLEQAAGLAVQTLFSLFFFECALETGSS
jgi:hypothetical protein